MINHIFLHSSNIWPITYSLAEVQTLTVNQVMAHLRRIAPHRKECRKVLTFAQLCYCCIILLIGSISKIFQNFRWLYIYLFLKLIDYFPFNKISSQSKYQSNPMWWTLENWKLLLPLFTNVVIGWNVFTQRKLPCFKMELKYILFHKPAFHQLINFLSENSQPFQCGKSVLPQSNKKCYSYLDHNLNKNMHSPETPTREP